MKKIISILIVFISLGSYAQDSTKVRNLPIQTRVIEYWVPVMTNPNNDSLHTVFLDLRAKFRVGNPPTGLTTVIIDSIPTVELANLYAYTLSNPDGMLQGGIVKAQLTAARAANSYLERLCAAHEAFWIDRVFQYRATGRKLLRGK